MFDILEVLSFSWQVWGRMEQPGPDVTGSKQSEAAAANLAQLDKCLEVLKVAKSDTEKFAALLLVCF